MSGLQFLLFERSEGDDGTVTLDALASTRAAQHKAVLAEVAAVLDWAGREFPGQQGPLEEGMTWHHDLQISEEPGGWLAVALSLGCTPPFADALLARFAGEEA
ncbi:MAG: hypothetical protein DI603_00565 [Roseateles depolymerans]|uniref:Uncharacterized protein n=1 Tax=Roseateles depolymerans TaxID=76731 RepID=A0A2W5E0V7_9BURK|nr:MAG: hypothetical protein DI603_00565 [Roseateles depolymerans]